MKVAVVGAGAIGTRHIQAMARIDGDLAVFVVDPAPAARAEAIGLLDQVGGLRGGRLVESDRIDGLVTVPDVAIVATNSRERPDVVRALLDLGVRKLILEKVLFTRLADYDDVGRSLAATGAEAWVNCPRRSYPASTQLRSLIDGQPFDYRVEGAGWGLGCNAIHHLDEYDMLSGAAALTLSARQLEPCVVDAKRAGYVEFFGALEGKSSAGRFSAVCTQGAPGDRLVTIETGASTVVISQSAKTMTIVEDGKARVESYPIPLQSESTADHINAILGGRAPGLPDYATASRLHRTMIETFLDHMRRVKNDPSIEECPIT